MGYDISSRTVPVPFTVTRGTHLEGIQYGTLSKSGMEPGGYPVKTTPLYGDDSVGPWIAGPFPHVELQEYFLVVELTDMAEHGCVETAKDPLFYIEIVVIAPQACSSETIQSAVKCCSLEKEDLTDQRLLAEALHGYGHTACVWQAGGDNQEQLITEAMNRLAKINGLFGFYMDQRMNRIGQTGWDVVGDRDVWEDGDES